MYVQFSGSEVRDVKLRIYEPPRFFEAFLRGRSFTEVADITARICGICPIAYQISSLRAVEDACGVAIDEGPIRDLRRLDLLRRVDREPRAPRLPAFAARNLAHNGEQLGVGGHYPANAPENGDLFRHDSRRHHPGESP